MSERRPIVRTEEHTALDLRDEVRAKVLAFKAKRLGLDHSSLDITEHAMQYAEGAVETLATIMANPSANDRNRILAAKEILTLSAAKDADQYFDAMSDADLENAAARILHARSKSLTDGE
jgi:hypothetical protein